ncbi:hypothetical protein H9Q74_004936 [Fusarium xylarioides]|nr:hypothetical protein H9Q74_004936 [Fusarium xylarioides]
MSPRSNEPPSPEAKERRARNRAAQLKFRKKKQEVDETRCNRIKHLESVVEKMSTVLVDFTDGLLQQDVVQQSSGMIASIQGVIADILTLANEAGDPEQDPKTRKARGKATEIEYRSPKDSEHELPSSDPSITITATPNDPMTAISSMPLADDSPINMPFFEDTTVPSSVAPTIYSQAKYPPSTIPAPLSPLLWTSSLPPLSLNSFICRLTYSCFKVGCLVLSRSIDAPLPLSEESRMFGSTLRYRERDEMILRMRWLLGPGKHELQTLAQLPWGGRWWDQEFSGSDLANYATNAAMVDSSAPQFLSVLGVEKQLIALGARFVDKDIIELDSSALAILSGNRLEPSCAQPESWSFVNLFPSKDSRPHIDAPRPVLSSRNIAATVASAGLPLSVDHQDGYGSRLREAVTQAIQAGAHGANIEDSIPARGLEQGIEHSLHPLSEQIRRLQLVARAAAAAGLPDFVINARCDVFALGDGANLNHETRMKEAVRRVKAYLDAGATTVFLWREYGVGFTQVDVQTLVKELDGRVAIRLGQTRAALSVSKLAKLGVARISIGPSLFQIAMNAAKRSALSVFEGGRLEEV